MSHSDPLRALVGQSAAMEHVRAQLRKLSSSPIPVLIIGETGTGKEVCATAIAALSGGVRMAAVNCAAIAESLVESELFGHERGAFTGAVREHAGMIAEAHRGILFLDELQEIPSPVQVKLLRTLESGEYRRVGSSLTRRSDFRILSATNRSPEDLVASQRLRSDLLYRLGCVRIWLPPLRQRREDIPLLAEQFLNRRAGHAREQAAVLEGSARSFLMQQEWPGNVRQLLHVVEAAAAIAGPGRAVAAEHLMDVVALQMPPSDAERVLSLAEVRRKAEQHAILSALRATEGDRERAAAMLDISLATLYRKLAPLEHMTPA